MLPIFVPADKYLAKGGGGNEREGIESLLLTETGASKKKKIINEINIE